jgi:hypothetical protein
MATTVYPTPNPWNNYLVNNGVPNSGVPISVTINAGAPPAAITAAGSDQAGATPLSANNAVITSGAAGTGVIATQAYHKIYNRSGNPILFYPASGVQFEGLAANAPMTINNNDTVEMFLITSTQGYVG